MKSLLRSGVPLVVSTVPELPGHRGGRNFLVLLRLSPPSSANNQFLSTSHNEMMRQRSANAACVVSFFIDRRGPV